MLSVALSLSPAEAEPAGRYPAPLFRGARTFLVSLARPAAARPSGEQRYSRFVDRFRVRSVDWPNVTFGWKADIRSRGRTSKPVLARSNPRTSARLVADFGTGKIRVNFQLHLRNLLSLPTRRLIRPTDYGRSFVGGQNRHEGRCGNLHDCHALFDCCPAYVNGLAAQGGTHRDPANRYFKRDARIAPAAAVLLRSLPVPADLMIQTRKSWANAAGTQRQRPRDQSRYRERFASG